MVEPERAKIGMPVTVRKKPMVVNSREFASRPFRGTITMLDPKGKGAYVKQHMRGDRFATWEEMTPRRLREGEREERVTG